MKESKDELITPALIDQAMSYKEYRILIDNLLEKGKTTGSNQSQDYIEFSRSNVQRMERLDKTVELNDELISKLKSVNNRWIWLVLTEAWCGDAAQNIPVIQKMAEFTPNIETKYILQNEHMDVMDQYLTNGGRSIPKLVCLKAETLREVGTWGPRPDDLQQKAMQWKDDPEVSGEEWVEKLFAWYGEDENQTIQSDFEALIEDWK